MKGGSLTGDFEGKESYQGMCRRRLWKRASLSVGALLGYLEEGGSAYWGVWEIGEGGLRKLGISLCRSSMRWTWRGGVSFARYPEEYVEECSGAGISLHGSPAGEPGWGLVYQGLMCWRRIWRRAFLSIGGPLRTWGVGGSVYRELWEIDERGLWKRASPSMGAVLGMLEESFFTGDPEGYVKEGSGNGNFSLSEPSLGTWSGLI